MHGKKGYSKYNDCKADWDRSHGILCLPDVTKCSMGYSKGVILARNCSQELLPNGQLVISRITGHLSE